MTLTDALQWVCIVALAGATFNNARTVANVTKICLDVLATVRRWTEARLR